MILRRVINTMSRKRQRLHLLKLLGTPCSIEQTACFENHENISFGKYVNIGKGCHLDGEGGLEIGNGTILGSRVVVLTSSHVYKQYEYLPYNENDDLLPVNIGRGVWFGFGAMVRPGVRIGDGAVIALGSVVGKDVRKGEVVAGNPAKVIGKRDEGWINQIVSMEKHCLRAVVEEGLQRTLRKTSEKLPIITEWHGVR